MEEVQIRLMATQVLGEMFADKGGADFMKKYPTTWHFWLARKNDKASPVRLAFVEASKGLLTSLGDMRDAVEGTIPFVVYSFIELFVPESLQSKLFDPDDKVRAAVCKVYSNLDYETALHHVSESQWKAIAGRGLDKKVYLRS